MKITTVITSFKEHESRLLNHDMMTRRTRYIFVIIISLATRFCVCIQPHLLTFLFQVICTRTTVRDNVIIKILVIALHNTLANSHVCITM
jgi:hypothetical protein